MRATSKNHYRKKNHQSLDSQLVELSGRDGAVVLLLGHAGPDAGDELHHVLLVVRTQSAVHRLTGLGAAVLAQPAGHLVRQLGGHHRLVGVTQVTAQMRQVRSAVLQMFDIKL